MTVRSLKSLTRPSGLLFALWLAFWIGIAALHAALFARRLVAGDWFDGPGQVKLILGLAGAIYGVYGSLRLRHLLDAVDRAPRKVLAVLLVSVLAHAIVAPPAGPFGAADAPPQAVAASFLLGESLVLAFALGMVMLWAAPGRSRPWASTNVAPPTLRRDRCIPRLRLSPICYGRPPPSRPSTP